MKKNIGKYPTVETLPINAVTVKQYAENNNFTTANVYKLYKERNKKSISFSIVLFNEINFVIPD